MWHANLALALAWFIPILIGVLVGFVLLRFSDEKDERPERRVEADDAAMWHV